MWIWQKKLTHALAVFVRTIVMLLCLSWRTTQESRWHIPIPWPMVDPQVIMLFNSKVVIHDLDFSGTTILGNLHIYISTINHSYWSLWSSTYVYSILNCCPSKFPWMKTQISPSRSPSSASLRFWIFSFVSRSRSSPRLCRRGRWNYRWCLWMGPGKSRASLELPKKTMELPKKTMDFIGSNEPIWTIVDVEFIGSSTPKTWRLQHPKH